MGLESYQDVGEIIIFLCDVVEDVSTAGNIVAAATWFDGMVFIGRDGDEVELLSTYNPDTWVYDSYLAGSVVHLLLSNGRVVQVDLANPREPEFVDTYDDAYRSVSARLGDGFMVNTDRTCWGGNLELYNGEVSARMQNPKKLRFFVLGLSGFVRRGFPGSSRASSWRGARQFGRGVWRGQRGIRRGCGFGVRRCG